MKCRHCSNEFEITKDDLDFYERVSPIIGGKVYPVSPPTLCHVCRAARRDAFRNDRTFYADKCALSGEAIISMFNPKYGYTVYDYRNWWSDQWNPMDFALEYDKNKSFFEQYHDLQKVVPRFNLYTMDNENCDFVNYTSHSKNCYLLLGSWFNEDCYFGHTVSECKECVDMLFLEKSELCYENTNCVNNYAAMFCRECSQTRESWFCVDCKGVSNCIGCYNLRDKEYHIQNKPVSKEEFEREVANFFSCSYLQSAKEKYLSFIKKNIIYKYYTGFKNEVVSGNQIIESKNVFDSYNIWRCEDCRYCYRSMEMKNSRDVEGIGKGELVYESISNDFAHRSICCTIGEKLSNCHYCDICFNCEDCFGCVGLRHKKNCILNKQYSKREYEELLPKLIEQMKNDGEYGEMMNPKFAPFGYNKTLAYEYYPLDRKTLEERGYIWEDDESKKTTDQSYEIPDDINEVDEEVLNQVLTCKQTGRNYKITAPELAFYKKMKLPIPRLHPDQRHFDRMATINPRQLWHRKCMNEGCDNEFETTYSQDREEKVYCEQCYQASIL